MSSTGFDRVDFLFKQHIGRLGFDASRPWYEEDRSPTVLLPASSIMTGRLPVEGTLPGLVQGGRVWLEGSDTDFDSSGQVVGVGDGVVTMRLRQAMTPVQTYKRGSGCYVYASASLSASCPQYGYVVEVLCDGAIEVIESRFVVVCGHVVFEDACWPPEQDLFVSFYEYTGGVLAGGLSEVVPLVTASPSTLPLASVGSLLGVTDELTEGIVNLFFTEERFCAAFSRMTSDDLAQGRRAEEAGREIEERLTQLQRMAREVKLATPTRLEDLEASAASGHFNREEYGRFFDECFTSMTTDRLSEGSVNLYLRADTLLSVASVLDTSIVREGQNRYFTEDRVREAVAPLLQELEGATTSGLLSLSRSLSASATTDGVREGSRLYFTDERVATAPAVLSVASVVEGITLPLLVAQLPAEERPVSAGEARTLVERLERTEGGLAVNTARMAELGVEAAEAMSATREATEQIKATMPRSTDDVTEGSRKYFTEDRVKDVITAVATAGREEVDEHTRDLAGAVAQNAVQQVAVKVAAAEAGVEQVAMSVERVSEGVERLQQVSDELADRSLGLDSAMVSVSNQVAQLTLDNIADGEERELLTREAFVEILDSMTLESFVETDSAIHLRPSHVRDIEDHSARLDRAEAWQVEASTDDIREGSAFLYFTNERARDAVLSDLSTTHVAESEGGVYFTEARCLSVCVPVWSRHADVLTEVLTESLRQDALSLQELVHTSLSTSVLGLGLGPLRSGQQALSSSVTELQAALEVTVAAQSVQSVQTALTSTTLSVHGSMLSLNVGRIEGVQSDLIGLRTTVTELGLGSQILPGRIDQLELDVDACTEAGGQMQGRLSVMEHQLASLETSSTTLSDDRLKFNEIPLTDALSVVQALEPLRYTMVTALGQDPEDGVEDVGFIAQDVSALAPLAHAVVPGTETVPFTLDYHSITTFAVAAVQELTLSLGVVSDVMISVQQRSTDDLIEGEANKFLTPGNLALQLSQVTADDIAPGVQNRYAAGVEASMKLEDLRLLLQLVDTDEIREGAQNRYNRDQYTTDDVTEGSNLYFTPERCDGLIEQRINGLTVDDITPTSTKTFLTVSSLLEHLQFVTADNIGNGASNKFFSRATLEELGLSTDDVTEGSALYFTNARAENAVTGMSTDSFAEGRSNLFSTVTSVRENMLSLSTADLNESSGRRYMSRDAYFELEISTGDIIGHASLARQEEVAQQLSATSLFHTEELHDAISASDLRLDGQVLTLGAEFDAKILSVHAYHEQELSASHGLLEGELSTSHGLLEGELSASHGLLEGELSASHGLLEGELSASYNILSTSQLAMSGDVAELSDLLLSVQVGSRLDAADLAFLSVSSVLDSLDVSMSSVLQSIDGHALQLSVHDLLSSNLSVSIEQVSLSLESSLLSVGSALVSLTTTDIPDTAGRRYVSPLALQEAHITTDLIPEGVSNRYATADAVKFLFSSSLTTADLPEAESHPYVSKRSLIETGVRPDELADYASVFSTSFLSALSDISSDQLVEGETNRYFTLARLRDELSVGTSDILPEGHQNIYFTTERVVNALSTASTDNIPEGVHLYFTSDRVLSVLSVEASTTQIKEGDNLYFTQQRALGVLSTANTDLLPEGHANRYLTRAGVLSLNLDVSEWTDEQGLLLTDDTFLAKASLLSTDIISTGSNKFVSTETVRVAMEGLSTDALNEGDANHYFTNDRADASFDDRLATRTTDDLSEGNTNRYFSEQLLTETLTVAHLVGTGISASDIGARPAALSIHTSELVESENAIFYTEDRFSASLATKTTDDISEGNNLYFSTLRVQELLEQTGTLTVATESDAPGRLGVTVTVSDTQTLSATIKVEVAGKIRLLELGESDLTFEFSELYPGSVVVQVTLVSRYGTEQQQVNAIVQGDPPALTSVSFTELEPGFTREMIIDLGGHGADCEVVVTSGTFEVSRTLVNLYEVSQVIIPLTVVFQTASVTLNRNDITLDHRDVEMPYSLVLPLSARFGVNTTITPDPMKSVPFTGLSLLITDNNGQNYDGNLFHSTETPSGALTQAQNTLNGMDVTYGLSSGTLRVSLSTGVAFASFLPLAS